MATYIFGHRNKIHIINLEKTLAKYNEAIAFVKKLSAKKGSILFVGDTSGTYYQDNARLFWDSTSYRLGLLTATPTIDLGMSGAAARIWGLERHSTANTAGNTLTIRAGGATTGATDKNGGSLILAPGKATGSGTSSVVIQAVAAGSAGTTDNSPATICTVASTGLSCSGTGAFTGAVSGTTGTFTGALSGTRVKGAQSALTSAAGAVTFDATIANSFKITLTEATTLTVSGAAAGQTITAIVCQDGTGSHTWAWPNTFKAGFTVTSTLNKCDTQDFICDGTNCWAKSAGSQSM
jgi:hypothetical protein